MPRTRPNRLQNLLAGLVLPLASVLLLPVSLAAVAVCLVLDRLRGRGKDDLRISSTPLSTTGNKSPGCVIISGGRMSKGLTLAFISGWGVYVLTDRLARAFKRAGWKVIGVDEEG